MKMKNIKTIQGAKKFFRILARKNDYNYILSKTCEELTELQEVLLKMMNKKGENKPPRQNLIEELGDVEIRLYNLKKRLKITQKDLNDRKIYKANKFIGYFNGGKYRKNI